MNRVRKVRKLLQGINDEGIDRRAKAFMKVKIREKNQNRGYRRFMLAVVLVVGGFVSEKYLGQHNIVEKVLMPAGFITLLSVYTIQRPYNTKVLGKHIKDIKSAYEGR